MGIGDITVSESSSSSSSSSSGSSSSSSSDGPFPKYEQRCPQVVLMDDGTIREYPTTGGMPFKTESERSGWYLDCPWPSDWREVWWSEDSFDYDSYVYEQQTDRDLLEDLRKDADRAYNRLLNARSEYSSGNTVRDSQRYRSCACCGDEIDTRYGDFEFISNSVVCLTHNVEELSSAGVI